MFSGNRLKKAREDAGYTRDTLAAELETSSSIIYKWEAGNTVPSANIVAKLSQLLKVTADYLLNLVDNPSAAITEKDLSNEEKELLSAIRRGDGTAAIKQFSKLFNQDEQDS